MEEKKPSDADLLREIVEAARKYRGKNSTVTVEQRCRGLYLPKWNAATDVQIEVVVRMDGRFRYFQAWKLYRAWKRINRKMWYSCKVFADLKYETVTDANEDFSERFSRVLRMTFRPRGEMPRIRLGSAHVHHGLELFTRSHTYHLEAIWEILDPEKTQTTQAS